jgi:hypothetical protein
MKQLLCIILVLPLLAACSGNKNVKSDAPTQLGGLSLVMFYTDN